MANFDTLYLGCHWPSMAEACRNAWQEPNVQVLHQRHLGRRDRVTTCLLSLNPLDLGVHLEMVCLACCYYDFEGATSASPGSRQKLLETRLASLPHTGTSPISGNFSAMFSGTSLKNSKCLLVWMVTETRHSSSGQRRSFATRAMHAPYSSEHQRFKLPSKPAPSVQGRK